MIPAIDKDFRLIEALLFFYGKFEMDNLTFILRRKTSKVRKLTSAYVKEYFAKRGTKPYKIITVGHYPTIGGSRYLRAEPNFCPITINHEKENHHTYFSKVLEFYSNFNGVKLLNTSLNGSDVALSESTTVSDKYTGNHYGEFLLFDLLLHLSNHICLIDVQKTLKLESPKNARYLVSLYQDLCDIKYSNKLSCFIKTDTWKPVVLDDKINALTFLSSLELIL